MQAALILFAAVGALFVVAGAVIATIALRNAPDGVEGANGFELVPAKVPTQRPATTASTRRDHYIPAVGHAA